MGQLIDPLTEVMKFSRSSTNYVICLLTINRIIWRVVITTAKWSSFFYGDTFAIDRLTFIILTNRSPLRCRPIMPIYVKDV